MTEKLSFPLPSVIFPSLYHSHLSFPPPFLSFPRSPPCHSRESGNPEVPINPGFPVKLGMTGNSGSPIRSGMTKKGMGMAEKAQI